MKITFTVFGEPKTAGSKRAFYSAKLKRAIITEDCAQSRDWKEQVASAARQVYQGSLLLGPLRVVFRFVRVRPASHYTGGGSLTKAARKMEAPETRPDLLKLARCVEDALSGVLWKDDSQITEEHLHKQWGEPSRVEIEVEAIQPERNAPRCELCGERTIDKCELRGLCRTCCKGLGGKKYSAPIVRSERKQMERERA